MDSELNSNAFTTTIVGRMSQKKGRQRAGKCNRVVQNTLLPSIFHKCMPLHKYLTLLCPDVCILDAANDSDGVFHSATLLASALCTSEQYNILPDV